jgi:SAM-dependent methyltransferase
MTDLQRQVATHYGRGGLLGRIKAGLRAAGCNLDNLSADDLKPVDEFHIGGAEATTDLLDQLAVHPGMSVLDIGSGIGGAARHVAGKYKCRVTGVDLTPEFVECARALSAMVGLGDATRFEIASATALPFADASFDLALLLHVGMNIPDKAGMMREVCRVLRGGGTFAIFDIMRTGPGDINYPVPWADTPKTSFVGSPDDYRQAAAGAGFKIVAERDRRDFALAFFAEQMARLRETASPPPLGVHLFMGEAAKTKLGNVIAGIEAGRIAPVELFLKAPA